jgi:hypothetical protein
MKTRDGDEILAQLPNYRGEGEILTSEGYPGEKYPIRYSKNDTEGTAFKWIYGFKADCVKLK